MEPQGIEGAILLFFWLVMTLVVVAMMVRR